MAVPERRKRMKPRAVAQSCDVAFICSHTHFMFVVRLTDFVIFTGFNKGVPISWFFEAALFFPVV